MSRPDGRIEAVTFDFWQTLMGEEPGHLSGLRRAAWTRILGESGHDVPEDVLRAAFEESWPTYQANWIAGRQYLAHAESKSVNLSQRGIALVTQRPYPLEMIVAIAPLLPTWDPERQLLARITNVRQEAESGWRLGCEFVNPLTDTELKSFFGDTD